MTAVDGARRIRLLPALVLLALVLALQAQAAGAGRGWCRKDPIVEVGGKELRVYVASPNDILGTATGPTRVEVAVPSGVNARLVWADDGFGYGYEVAFAESGALAATPRGTEVRVEVVVPAAHDALPVAVDLEDGADRTLGSSQGKVNERIVAKARL